MIPFAMSATSFSHSGTAKEVVGALHGALAVVEHATRAQGHKSYSPRSP